MRRSLAVDNTAHLLVTPPVPAPSKERGSKSGVHPLGLRSERDALLFVPKSAAAKPSPLLVFLHGAGGNAEGALSMVRDVTEENGSLVLAVSSVGATWDFLMDDFGPDVEMLQRALKQVLSRYGVDRVRLAIGGFSDGASYALSVGLANGDLFTHIVAFSPGFMRPPAMRGKPRVFISHGVADTVLPINQCSRRIVPGLKANGYAVTYREFPGPHLVPDAIRAEALQWMTGR